MNIRRWNGKSKIILKKNRKVINVEMIKETAVYKEANVKDVINAMKKCTEKYEKALINLAK